MCWKLLPLFANRAIRWIIPVRAVEVMKLSVSTTTNWTPLTVLATDQSLATLLVVIAKEAPSLIEPTAHVLRNKKTAHLAMLVKSKTLSLVSVLTTP